MAALTSDCGHPEGGHAHRIQPDAHGQEAAKDIGFADALQRGQLGLYRADEVVSDLVWIHLLAVERQVHHCVATSGGGDTGSSTSEGRSPRASLTLAITSDSTSRLLSPRRTCTSISELPGLLIGCHVLNAAGAGDTDLQRRGDETLHRARTRTRVDGFHVNDAAFQFREFAHVHARHRRAAKQQQQAADHDRQHGPCMKWSVNDISG